MELDEFLFRPVIAGMWQHVDVVEERFTFMDLLDIHEALDLKIEDAERHQAWRESQHNAAT